MKGYDVTCSTCGALVGYYGLNEAEAHALARRHERDNGTGHATSKQMDPAPTPTEDTQNA